MDFIDKIVRKAVSNHSERKSLDEQVIYTVFNTDQRMALIEMFVEILREIKENKDIGDFLDETIGDL